MTENESVKFFLRIVQEKHNIINQRLNELFKILASDNHNEKVKANELLLGACEDLAKILSNSDRPSWLDQFIKEAKIYSTNHQKTDHNFRLLNNIVSHKNNALSHSWSFEQSNIEADYNFDSVYELFKKNSKLPKFFDALINTLEKMISSGEIDSITALKNLEQLIAIIKQNKTGSYFSVMMSWELISGFTKNLVWQELSSLPGIKQFKSAYEKTVDAVNICLEIGINYYAQKFILP